MSNLPYSPLFSVLVANYNNGKYLEDCLQSIFSQTYPSWEIVIVDDGSTDDSETIYKKYSDHTQMRIFHNEKNEGCGFTKRKCVELARGEICGFVDPDDAIMPDALAVMVAAHQEYPDCSLVSSKFYLTDLDLNIKSDDSYGQKIPDGYSYLTYGKYAVTHFATFKHEKYNETEGINPNLKSAVDQDLYYRLEEVGRPVFIDKRLYKYRVTPQSISVNENTANAVASHFRAIEDAYRRRLKNPASAKNFSRDEFELRKYAYFQERMYYETLNRKLIYKYYYLFRLIIKYPFRDIKYKLKCLLKPFRA